MSFRHLLSLFVIIIITACEPDIKEFRPSSGEADFTVFVALGNSLTAGFADGDLYISSQMVSYPNIIANQMTHVGNEDFKLPLLKDEYGLYGNRITLGSATNCFGDTIPAPILSGLPVNPANFININSEGPFHNLGVPGAKVSDLLDATYANTNLYYGRFASSENARIIDEALLLDPTFFSLWIGANDILGYALSGGTSGGITSYDDFAYYFNQLMTALTSRASKGVVANIPNITSIPYFNTLPPRGLIITSQEQLTTLNHTYASMPHLSFQMGINGFVVADSNAPFGIRQLKDNELLLLNLPQDSIRCSAWGSLIPIHQRYYLSERQIDLLDSAIKGYNIFIEEKADELQLAYVDVNHLLEQGKRGLVFDGLEFNTSYILGGIFSLDGIHLSARGNAIIANYFIEAINKTYGSSIPQVSVTQFQGIVLP